MNTIDIYFQKSIKEYILLISALIFSLSALAQDPDPAVDQDSVKTGFSLGTLKMPNPNSIQSKYTYDPKIDRYIYTETVGSFNINYPIILTPQEYQDLVLKENLKARVMSYSTKFRSAFYDGFRQTIGVEKGIHRGYQLDVTDRELAICRSQKYHRDGADMLMVKPGMTSIDLIRPIKEAT